MPFDDKKFDALASNGDVGGAAISTSLAIDALIRAIKAIKNGEEPDEWLERAKETSDALAAQFEDLTGYTKT